VRAAVAGASAARVVAHRTLLRVERDGAYADAAFRTEAERAGLDARDRAFAQRLAYGAVQRRATIDHVLAGMSSRPLARVDPPLAAALRLGVYQLVWAGGVPDRAAVGETVELAKAAGGQGAASFANAIMRRASRDARAVVEGLGDDTAEAAALAHSVPAWLAAQWWEELGPEDARALIARSNEAPESALRVNTLRATPGEVGDRLASAGVPVEAAPELPEGLVLGAPFDIHGSDLFREGLVMPQSRGSMLVARALAPSPGERVLDLCAAPGAKATHLLALMEGEGSVVAVERRPARAEALAENARRLGADAVEVRVGDAADPQPDGPFDRVLLDPPCSDLGTLQSRPDLRWRKEPETVARVAGVQSGLLDAAAAQVRPGGRLVYSTCTISLEENERQVERFLARSPGFRLAASRRLFPHRDGTDGFFIATLERDG